MRKFTTPTSLLILKSPKILGFLRSSPTKTVFFSLSANTEARFIEQNVFPSPLTELVTNTVLAPFMPCFLYMNCKLDRRALKASAIADFGLVRTTKLLSIGLFPIMPKSGMEVIRSRSFTLLILVSKNTRKNTKTKGKNNPSRPAII